MEDPSLAEHYRELDDNALLRIATDRKDLTPEAAMALDAELSSRRLGTRQVEQVAKDDQQFERHEVRTKTKTGRNSGFYGHANVQHRMEAEIYTATLFLAALGFPLIPTGTYRLMRSGNEKWWWRSDPKVVEKLPLDWNQVFRVWGAALAVLLGILLILKLLT